MGGQRREWARRRPRAGRVLGALLVAAAAAWLLSPPEPAPPEVAPFGTAAPETERPRDVGSGRPGGGTTTVTEPAPGRGRRPAARPVDSAPRPASSSLDAFGVYIGGEDLGTVESYEEALGLPDDQALRHVLRYAEGKSDWAAWRRTVQDLLAVFDVPGQPRTLVLSLPLVVGRPLPADHPDLRAGGLSEDPRSLEAGAAGAYDGQWRWLGQELARRFGRELPTSVLLRPGWEANGHWYDWGYGIDDTTYDVERAGAFARYWRRLHDVVTGELRASGTDVHWVLNAAAAYTSGGFEAAWPGDDYVDIVSLDLYQNHAFRSTTDFAEAEAALRWLEAVGAARDKLVALDETSVSARVRNGRQLGGGDNGLWFRSLRAWSDRVVANGRLHHLLAFEADPAPDDLFGPMFPRYPEVATFPEARRDLIASFGGARPPGEGARIGSRPGLRLGTARMERWTG